MNYDLSKQIDKVLATAEAVEFSLGKEGIEEVNDSSVQNTPDVAPASVIPLQNNLVEVDPKVVIGQPDRVTVVPVQQHTSSSIPSNSFSLAPSCQSNYNPIDLMAQLNRAEREGKEYKKNCLEHMRFNRIKGMQLELSSKSILNLEMLPNLQETISVHEEIAQISMPLASITGLCPIGLLYSGCYIYCYLGACTG